MEALAPAISQAQQPGLAAGSALLYLRLPKRCLIRDLFPDQRYDPPHLDEVLPYSRELRQSGLDWPTEAETMVGMKRLENLQQCCTSAINDGIPGDFVETGVWRGGCGILLRATLEACEDRERKVWQFDSFQGLPKPDANSFPADDGDRLWTYGSYLGISLEEVKANFEKYELLDDRTIFIKGLFRDTVPHSEIGSISVLRLDGDMYESTWLVLTHFYPRLSRGGFVIIDDYGAIPNCKVAVDEFRREHCIDSPMTTVDWTGVFWRK